MTKEEFSSIASSIPHKAGVYRYYKAGKLLYVGKAKDLRKRVSSYFIKNKQWFKTEKLVFELDEIKFTIVNSEHDALLLENSLIKEHQPKYNIELKDDKSFPFIVIKKEAFPRVFLTRQKIKDGSTYIGPFTSVKKVRELLNVIRRTLPIRTCNLDLSPKEISKKKYRACLQYQIGNCKAPCVGLQDEEAYNWHIKQIKEILRGKTSKIQKSYKKEIKELSENLEYEKAAAIKAKLDFIKNFQSRSVVANTKLDETEVLGLVSNEHKLYANYILFSQGNIVNSISQSYVKKLGAEDKDILPNIILQLREQCNSQAKTIIVPYEIDLPLDVIQKIPKSGEAQKVLDLSVQNAKFYMDEEKRQSINHIKQKKASDMEHLLEQLQVDLRLPFYPKHIECFDNSNFQGSYPVAAMVCFKDGVPSKKDYRKFNIKTVVGIDDFASMREVVFRRYSRLKHEKKDLPQLVIIDGGKGQLSASIDALQDLELLGKITVVGLAKNVEEIFYPGDSDGLRLPYESESLKFVRRVRDEVHRFGITFHRKKRSKGIIKNELEDIKGIGKKTATDLLRKYKSVKKIKQLAENELAEFVGPSKAKIIREHFKHEK